MLKNSSIPVDIRADIPFVERPYDRSIFQMGGTTPSFMSEKLPNIYQVSPPHPQNILSVQHNGKSFNDGPRRCYNVYSSNQNVEGRICSNVSSNGDIYRGNQFSLPPMKKRLNYSYNVPEIKDNNITYVSKDLSYPLKDRSKPLNYLNESIWNKEYPKFKNYNDKGVPMWNYPYLVENMEDKVEVDNEDKVEKLKDKKLKVEDKVKVKVEDKVKVDKEKKVENFLDKLEMKKESGLYFWSVSILILLSLISCKMLKK